MFYVQPCQAVSSEAVRVFSDHTVNEELQSSGERQAKVKGLVQKLQQAVERLQAGGEISLPLYNFNYCHLPLARLSQKFGKV